MYAASTYYVDSSTHEARASPRAALSFDYSNVIKYKTSKRLSVLALVAADVRLLRSALARHVLSLLRIVCFDSRTCVLRLGHRDRTTLNLVAAAAAACAAVPLSMLLWATFWFSRAAKKGGGDF
eukprot:19542-Heterococcus_DN1.PRE.1